MKPTILKVIGGCRPFLFRVILALVFFVPFSGCGSNSQPAAPDASGQEAGSSETSSPEGMVRVPQGEFQMGCSLDESELFCDELVSSPWQLSATGTYWIDRREVAVDEYQECIDDMVCTVPGRCVVRFGDSSKSTYFYSEEYVDMPITSLSKYEALAYCRRLGKRLCTEEEWERACTGDSGTVYPWGNLIPECDWLNAGNLLFINHYIYPKVCEDMGWPFLGSVLEPKKDISPFGVEGMAGNGREFISDLDDESWPQEILHRTKGGECWFRSGTSSARTEQHGTFRCCCTPEADGGECAEISDRGVQQAPCRQDTRKRSDEPVGMQFVHCGSISLGGVIEVQGDRVIPSQITDKSVYGECLSPYYAFVDSFWMDTHEVPVEDYLDCVSNGACDLGVTPTEPGDYWAVCPDDRLSYLQHSDPQFPASCVTFDEAAQFCQWQGKRLCSHLEWERAGRGVDHRMFPWGNTAPTCSQSPHTGGGNTEPCVHSGPAAVGSLVEGASPFGIMELSGSVAEYLAPPEIPAFIEKDFDSSTSPYDTDSARRYLEVSWDADPKHPLWDEPANEIVVLRGGSFRDQWQHQRLTFQVPFPRSTASKTVGFRCCLSDELEQNQGD